MKSIYLVDASSMFFRAHYAVKTALSNSKGFPTGALYGFLQMTIKLLKEVNPDYIAYCFDRKEPSFRKDLFAEYKANRSEMPEDLQKQVPYLKEITKSLGIPTFDQEGLEADDLIGILCTKAKKSLQVVIISGDKDFAQLIGPNVVMLDTMKNVRYDEDRVFKKWGVKPTQMIDYLAICGDSADNIPGVYGIGQKGASKLLDQFSSLEVIYSNLDQIKNEKLKQKLIENKEKAFLSKTLVTILETSKDFEVKLDDLKQKEVDRKKISDLLTKLEFKNFEQVLFGNPEAEKRDLGYSVQELKKGGLNKGDTVWGFLFKDKLVVGLDKQLYTCSLENIDLINHIDQLQLKWKGYDPKNLFRELNFKNLQSVNWSSSLAAYCLDSKEINSFNELYQIYTSESLPTIIEIDYLYDSHIKLASILEDRLNNSSTKDIFNKLELPLVSILFEMEKNGILLDVNYLKKISVDFANQLKDLEAEIFKYAGFSFNISSPKQLATVLFEKLGLPIVKKKKTGPSTDSSVLEALIDSHPIIKNLIDYREISKLKSTYVDVLPTLLDHETGRIHTYFRQASVITGRLSSVNPNLQNIPIKTKRGKEIRKAFKAPDGCKLVSFDYSQIELRLLAHITDDDGLKNAFFKNQDVHAITASELFDVTLDEITQDQRRVAKSVNFGLAYGQTAFGLSNVIKVTNFEAQKIIDNYFKKFPKVLQYMSNIVEESKKSGFVETLFGRRRMLSDINSPNAIKRKMAERAAINTPLQGSASDLVKKAMIEISKTPYKMLLQVHDELVFEIKDELVDKASIEIKECMENVVKLKVPLKVDVFSSKDWSK